MFITAWYFTITTVTTVGYGDFNATNTTEMIFGSFIMVIGVVLFSYISGALASFMTSADASQDKLHHELMMVDRIDEENPLGRRLYQEMK
jgi:potassium voltage-gated channel Eag-related subfamily H protein 6/hyperpolarization activated cyclic nucleotide-gated potassium channel 2